MRNSISKWLAVITFAAVGVSAARAGAGTKAPVRLQRLSGKITLDGRSDEPAWEKVRPVPVTMYRPTFGGELTERTEIRVTYDDTYFYVAGRFYDSDPRGIRANSLYRDQDSDSDVFTLILDTFNDNENARVFWTNPAGVRGDRAISNDGYASDNDSWNTYWDVATEQDELGWFMEMRIPFSSLGFQTRGGRVVMGITVSRLIARKLEEQTYPAIPSEFSVDRPSLTQDILLEGISSRNPIYATPYGIGGFGQKAMLNQSGDAYQLNDEFKRDLGLDVKYNITSNLTFDGTINTDFAQVEADDQQVNLTRFSLFFPEKRQFFQERSGIFSFTTTGSDRLFHSRQIGLYKGTVVPIIAGARLIGRLGQWDVGAINMQTAQRGSLDLPSENFGVLRLRRQVLNSVSTAGGMLTSRIGDDGSYNVAYGLDAVLNTFGHEYLTAKWSQTFDRAALDARDFNFADTGQLYLLWQRRRGRGWTYFQDFVWSGKDYMPALGFVSRKNYFGGSGLLHLNRYPGQGSPFFRTMPVHLQYEIAIRNSNRSVESFEAGYQTGLWWKNGHFLYATADLLYEDLLESLFFSDSDYVPAGHYTFYDFSLSYNTPSGRTLQFIPDVQAGSFYDGAKYELGLHTIMRQSRYLGLEVMYFLTAVRFPDRDQDFNAHIARIRVQTAANTKLSMNAFVQFSSAADLFSANVRFRYNVREGNDFWIVYNEGLNTDRRLPGEALRLPRTNQRTVLVKYTYTFTL